MAFRSSVILSVIVLTLGLLGVTVASAAPPAPSAPSAQARPTLTVTATRINDDQLISPRTRINVTVTADGQTPTGTIEGYDTAGALHGTATLVDGSAYVDEDAVYAPGTYTFKVRYLGDDTTAPADGSVQLVVPDYGSSTEATATPDRVAVYGAKTSIRVHVFSGYSTRSTFNPLGTVTISGAGVTSRTATLTQGENDGATVAVGPFPHAGAYDLTVSYSGTQGVMPSDTHVSVTAFHDTTTTTAPRVVVYAPHTVTQGARPWVTVKALSAGRPVDGRVTLSYRNRTITAALSDGSAVFRLAQLRGLGSFPVRADYLGGSSNAAASLTRTITVVRR